MRIVWWRLVLLGLVTLAAGTGAWFAFTRPPSPVPAAARQTAGPVEIRIAEPTPFETATPVGEPSAATRPVPSVTSSRSATARPARKRSATPGPTSRPRPTRTPSIAGLPGMGTTCDNGRCPGQ